MYLHYTVSSNFFTQVPFAYIIIHDVFSASMIVKHLLDSFQHMICCEQSQEIYKLLEYYY